MKTKISHRTIPDPTGRTRSLTSCVIFLLILYQKTEIKSTLKNSQVDPRDKGVYFPQSFRSLDYDTILHQSWNIVNPEAADTAVPPVSKANIYTHLCMSLMFIEEHRQLLEGAKFRSRLNKKALRSWGFRASRMAAQHPCSQSLDIVYPTFTIMSIPVMYAS